MAEGKSCQPLVIAAVHEYASPPIVVRLTPKVRRFFHAAFRKAPLDPAAKGRPSIGSLEDRPE